MARTKIKKNIQRTLVNFFDVWIKLSSKKNILFRMGMWIFVYVVLVLSTFIRLDVSEYRVSVVNMFNREEIIKWIPVGI